MKFTNKRMVEEAMVRIEHLQAHISAIEAAARCIHERKRHIQIEYGTLRELLYQEEMSEWRNLFMWAITLDEAERDRVKAAAHHRFLADGMHVAHWINNGVSPGSWLSADEDEFRAMAKAAFMPNVELRGGPAASSPERPA
jgi:hypothetical protein